MLPTLLLSLALAPAQLGPTEEGPPPAPLPVAAVNLPRPLPEAPAPADAAPAPVEIIAPLLATPPAAPAEEEAPASAAAAADRWALMRALQGTWPGSLLDDHRMSLWGWVDGSYTVSSASRVNTPVVWNDFAEEFLLQQAWVRFERSVVTSGTTEPTFGFRMDWLFGSDYRFTLPRGIFNGQFTQNDGLPNRYGVDPIAFYAQAYFPTIAQGLDLKVGRFFTPFGVESLEAISTPTVSRSHAFNWAPPFTHTGVLATTTLNPKWTVAGGLVLGNDIFFDSATEGRFVGFVKYTAPGARDTITLGTSLGRGKFNDVEAQNHINVVDLVWAHVINSRLTYNLEIIYGWQYNTALPGSQVPTFDEAGAPVFDETGSPVTQAGVGMANWGSVVNYLFYTFSPQVTGMFRLEFFDDFDGHRTGFEGLYTAATVGLTYKPCKSVWIRPELRYDYNCESQPFEGKNWLFTASTDVIIRW